MANSTFKQTLCRPSTLFTNSLADQSGLLAFAKGRCKQSLPWDLEHLSNTCFRVKTHHSSVTFQLEDEDDCVHLHARWWMKSLWDDDGQYLSEDDLFNEADIVGWLSMVKTNMTNAGVQRLIALFQNRNLFPNGRKAAIRSFTESSRVFSDFRIGPDEVIGVMHKALVSMYHPLWQIKGDAWVLQLDGIQVGAMVARLTDNQTKWRILVPFQESNLDFKGRFYTANNALDSLRTDMPDILLRKLIESVVLGYLSPSVPDSYLPTEWLRTRNDVLGGWTT